MSPVWHLYTHFCDLKNKFVFCSHPSRARIRDHLGDECHWCVPCSNISIMRVMIMRNHLKPIKNLSLCSNLPPCQLLSLFFLHCTYLSVYNQSSHPIDLQTTPSSGIIILKVRHKSWRKKLGMWRFSATLYNVFCWIRFEIVKYNHSISLLIHNWTQK